MSILSVVQRFFRPLQDAPAPPPPAVIPDYFLKLTWAQRRDALVRGASPIFGPGFASANADRIACQAAQTGTDAHLHVVFNLGAAALLDFLDKDDYKNVYENPVVNGALRAPSATRIRVDRMLPLEAPEAHYFCALALGGAGVRFYGEYCAVLKSPADASGVTKVLDRNSYDLIAQPLAGYLARLDTVAQRKLIGGLSAPFRSPDFGHMLATKVLQAGGGQGRLLSQGTLGAAIIQDEDYLEAFHFGKIRLASVLELREDVEQQFRESSIGMRLAGAAPPTVEELLWLGRRQQVREQAAKAGIAITAVSGSARKQRWQ